ncbi:MAG: type II toxin-antitoxin system death-on-curing family toxin [Duodenibacillus massiliensis]
MHDAVLMRFRGLASAQAPGFLKERINGLLGGVELKLDCSTATDAVVFRTAGELLSALARAHLFSDGNKRTAVLSALLFLLRSGHDVSATTDAVQRLSSLAVNAGALGAVAGEEAARVLENLPVDRTVAATAGNAVTGPETAGIDRRFEPCQHDKKL